MNWLSKYLTRRNPSDITARPRFGVERLEDRSMPTVMVAGTQLQLIDDAGTDNGFNVRVAGSNLVVTDAGQDKSYPLASVGDVLAVFGQDANEEINIDGNGNKPVTILVNEWNEAVNSVSISLGRNTGNLDGVTNNRRLLETWNSVSIVPSALGQYNLTLNDGGNTRSGTSADAYTVTDHSVGRTRSGTVSYPAQGFQWLHLNSGAGASTFNVISCLNGTGYSPVIQTGGGADTVIVGGGPAGLDAVAGAVKVIGAGTARVVYDDSTAVADHHFQVYREGVNRLEGGVVDYEDIASLVIRGGDGDDSFKVFRTPSPGCVVSLDGGKGIDSLTSPDYTVNVWRIASEDTGTLAFERLGETLGTVSFASVGNLNGGHAPDTFVFDDGRSVSGRINAGDGT